MLVAAASLINLLLGLYLVRTGKREHSLIVEANGKHVLTDSWTSFGVVGGLLLVLWTGWQPFDPLLAIVVACNILWSGGKLFLRSVQGLMDYVDPATTRQIEQNLQQICASLGVRHHELRFRHTGTRLIIEFHVLFPYVTTVGDAHRIATEVEQRLAASLDSPAEVITHLESLEDHDLVHNTKPR
jgi:cation diffusion facilitator family transporter